MLKEVGCVFGAAGLIFVGVSAQYDNAPGYGRWFAPRPGQDVFHDSQGNLQWPASFDLNPAVTGPVAANIGKCAAWQNNPEAQKALSAEIRSVAQTMIVDRRVAPGVTIAVGCGTKMLASVGVGEVGNGGGAASPEKTEYDLASVSKKFTTLGIFKLVQDGKLRLDQPVGKYLPEYSRGEKAKATFRMLLQHRSGLVDSSYNKLLAGTTNPSQAWQRVLGFPLTNTPGEHYEYSNIGFNVVWQAASVAAGEPLQHYLKRELFDPLGMTHTGYAPNVANCAPTSPDDDKSQVLTCVPQDKLARALGGIGGHAGWYSTVIDMGKLDASLVSASLLNDKPIILPSFIKLMQTHQPNFPNGTPNAYATGERTNLNHLYGNLMSTVMFGHTGSNGTAAFADPTTSLWSEMFTNGTLHGKAPTSRGYAAYRGINDAVVRANNAVKK